MVSKTLISVHVPKTGGSSLRDELSARLGGSLLLDYDHSPRGARAAETVGALPAGVAAVHGHFRPARYAQLPQAYLFTFLRDPVDAMIARYFHWRGPRSRWRDWLAFVRAETTEAADRRRQRSNFEPGGIWADVVQFAVNSGTRHLLSQLYFSDFDMGRFDFIGFYETRQQDMARLSQQIGLDLRASRHSNRSRHSRRERNLIDQDSDLRVRLRDVLSDDVRFYEQQRAYRS